MGGSAGSDGSAVVSGGGGVRRGNTLGSGGGARRGRGADLRLAMLSVRIPHAPEFGGIWPANLLRLMRERERVLLLPILVLVCARDVTGFGVSPAVRGYVGISRRLTAIQELQSWHVRCCAQLTAATEQLTMEEVRKMFQDVRAHYRSTGELDEGQVCRNMMVTRVKDFSRRIDRCEVRLSKLHGDGLFATRDIEEGELITFFPSDALLVWEGGDRAQSDVMMFFGAHVPQSDRDAAAILDRVQGYELFVTGAFSAVGDPSRRDDPAYLGHLANDGSICLSPDGAGNYLRESAEAANAAPVWIEGCHCGLQAGRRICKGDEIVFSYGEGYWLSRSGHGGIGEDIRRLGSASHEPRGRLKQALQRARPKQQAKKQTTKAGQKAKLRKRLTDVKKGTARGFGS